MEPLDTEGGFDVHDHRDGLKLVEQDSDSWQLVSRDAYICPACGRAFDRLFVTGQSDVTFDSAPNGPICVVRAPEKLLVVAH